jgi:hypothetical protein
MSWSLWNDRSRADRRGDRRNRGPKTERAVRVVVSATLLLCATVTAGAEERQAGLADIFSRSTPRPPRSVPRVGAKVDGAKVDGAKADGAKADGAKADHATSAVASKPPRPENSTARSTSENSIARPTGPAAAHPAVSFPPVAPLE